MKPERKQLSPGRRMARALVWTSFLVVLFLRFVVWRDQPFGFRLQEDRPPPRNVWQQRPPPEFRRPPADLKPPIAEVPKDFPRIHIDIPPAGVEVLRGYFWNGWRSRQQERPEVLATVREGGAVFTNVAVHLKGAAGSFRPFQDKPALTLNFSKHARGQRFHGMSKISLNNSVQDPTFISESLCRELFNAADVPAPTADWATVLVNERDLGFYVLLEGYNKDFLRRHFKNVKGNLYDGGFCQEVNTGLAVNSGDAPDDHSDIERLIDAASDPAPESRWQQLNDVLDMDRFLTMLAMEVAMCHWDGYGLNRNNYRLFHDLETGKMIFMPHGLDQMFDWPPHHRFPTDGSIQPMFRGMIATAVLGTPEGGRQYFEHLTRVQTNIFQEERVIGRVRALQARMRPTLEAYSPAVAERHDAAVASLCERIHRRIQSVNQQLAVMADPLQFDTSGAAYLTNWVASGRGPRLDYPQVPDKIQEDGRTLLHLSGSNRAGWRTQVLVQGGQYRVEGRFKASPEALGARVAVRVTGVRPQNQVIAATDWQPISFPFKLAGFRSEVWITCEYSGNRGDVWLDLDSLRLVRE